MVLNHPPGRRPQHWTVVDGLCAKKCEGLYDVIKNGQDDLWRNYTWASQRTLWGVALSPTAYHIIITYRKPNRMRCVSFGAKTVFVCEQCSTICNMCHHQRHFAHGTRCNAGTSTPRATHLPSPSAHSLYRNTIANISTQFGSANAIFVFTVAHAILEPQDLFNFFWQNLMREGSSRTFFSG